jgi:hypothetical protein
MQILSRQAKAKKCANFPLLAAEPFFLLTWQMVTLIFFVEEAKG